MIDISTMDGASIEKLDSAADALRRFEMKGRVLLPWNLISMAQRQKWREKASVVLNAWDAL